MSTDTFRGHVNALINGVNVDLVRRRADDAERRCVLAGCFAQATVAHHRLRIARTAGKRGHCHRPTPVPSRFSA